MMIILKMWHGAVLLQQTIDTWFQYEIYARLIENLEPNIIRMHVVSHVHALEYDIHCYLFKI